MKIGLIARCDKSGLGAQTRRLARLLKPDKVMLIDSTSFNGSKQYHEWYKNYQSVVNRTSIMTINGFPGDQEIKDFLLGLDVVISCETFYNQYFTVIAKQMKVKTILIANPEFFDWFKPDYRARVTLPDKVIVPSLWMMDKMKEFNAEYLPTPIFEDEFEKAREINFKGSPFVDKRKYLFLNGKTAAHDRAGLESLYEALQLAKGDFEIVVKAQGEVKKHPDPRLTYDFSNPDEQWKLYAGFDAMIHPRRYGGQSLPMTEALQSGLPVIMTDIDPNNKVLPKEWLVPATKTGEFMTRTMIGIYSSDSQALATKLDGIYSGIDHKLEAIDIFGKQYDAETLRPEYERIIHEL